MTIIKLILGLFLFGVAIPFTAGLGLLVVIVIDKIRCLVGKNI